jgi:hypothetical protein
MSLAALRRPAAASDDAGASLLRSPLILAFLALILSIAKFWPGVVTVWTTGAYANTDDAMRLVEVRDWLAGQAWFDLHQYRLDPPGGVFMHWTRVIDVPLAALIKLFSLVLPIEQAERLTRIVYPLALLFALYAAIISLARRLAGPSAMLPAAMMIVLAGAVFGQFEPGRIHHHTAQILLVVLMLRATIEAAEAARLGFAALAAALAALSLSINVENIAYVLVEIAAFALIFVAKGETFRRALLAFAGALAAASLAMFFATIGPSRYFVGACDAFSIAHVFAIFVGAAALAILAAGSPLIPRWPLRLAAAAFGGAIVLAAMALAYPACLHDPLAAVDPLLRQYWLSQVEEARPLVTMILAKPRDLFIFAVAPFLGLAAAVFAARVTKGEARVAWLIIAAFAGVGLATSLWQVRAISSASALALSRKHPGEALAGFRHSALLLGLLGDHRSGRRQDAGQCGESLRGLPQPGVDPVSRGSAKIRADGADRHGVGHSRRYRAFRACRAVPSQQSRQRRVCAGHARQAGRREKNRRRQRRDLSRLLPSDAGI